MIEYKIGDFLAEEAEAATPPRRHTDRSQPATVRPLLLIECWSGL